MLLSVDNYAQTCTGDHATQLVVLDQYLRRGGREEVAPAGEAFTNRRRIMDWRIATLEACFGFLAHQPSMVALCRNRIQPVRSYGDATDTC